MLIIHSNISSSARKMLLFLVYVIVLFHKSETIIHSSLNTQNLHIQKFLDNLTNTANFNELILINCYFQITVPSMYFGLKEKPTLNNPTKEKTMIILNTTQSEQITNSLHNFVQYARLLEKAYILVLIMEEPDQKVMEFLQQNRIYKVVFVRTDKVEFSLIKGKMVQKFQRFKGWPDIPKVLRVCYSDSVPYTTIGSGQKGLDLLIVNQACDSVKLSATFTKQTGPCISGKTLGVFEHLRNKTCDLIQGVVPCFNVLPYCEPSGYFLADATVLVSPTFRCFRNVGLIKVRPEVFVSFLCALVSVFTLFKCNKTRLVTVLVITPLLLVTVVILGYIQAQLYDTLVRDQQLCNVKNIEDIVRRKLVTGVESGLAENLFESYILNTPSGSLKPYLVKDDNLENLNPETCHIIREVVFKYLVPKYYLMENGQAKLKIVQTLRRGLYNLLMRRGYPWIEQLNLGLLKVQESGLSRYLEEHVCGRIHLNDIAKYSVLLSYFTPVKLPEIYWLLACFFVMLLMSLLVFLMEIAVDRWFTHN